MTTARPRAASERDRRVFPRLVLAVLAAFSFGCGTLTSFSSGCPGVYSGVRTDITLLQSYDSFGYVFDGTLAVIDLPFSTFLDTVALPGTAFVDSDNRATDLGCGWAAPAEEEVARH